MQEKPCLVVKMYQRPNHSQQLQLKLEHNVWQPIFNQSL